MWNPDGSSQSEYPAPDLAGLHTIGFEPKVSQSEAEEVLSMGEERKGAYVLQR
jgi:hypothetical protein